jgi:hypoxanthine phosphoribosyltransferase
MGPPGTLPPRRKAPETLYSEAEIARRVDELAASIAAGPLPEGDPLLLVCLLRGAFVFSADLMRALDRHGVEAEIEFLGLSSYGAGRSSSGRVDVTADIATPLAGRDAIVLDDILDSGRSLAFAIELLRGRGAARVRSCVLLSKSVTRAVAVEPDLVGFTCPDVFVVGYGMDDAGRYRSLRAIARVPD